jgi:tetratricopeptide (TPR) repeat protein
VTRRVRKRFLWTGVLLAALGSLPIGPSTAHAGLAALDAYHVGRYHLANGDRDKALEAFDDAVRMNPQFVQAYIARGKLYAEMGKFESALADLNFAVRIQPTHPEAFAYRGYALLSLGRPQESIPEFDMALRLDQSYARVYFLRGQALKLLGDDTNSASSIALARRLDPTIELTKVVTAGADGSLKEDIGLVSGERPLERTPGAAANGMPGDDPNGQAPGARQPGRVIHFQDHPLLGDLKPPHNARPFQPAPHTHAHAGTRAGQSSGYPQQFGASRPQVAATRAISPSIPDITAVPETPLPASPAGGADTAPAEAPLDLVGTDPPMTGAHEAASAADTGVATTSAPSAQANAPAKITLSPQTIVDLPAGAAAGEMPQIIVIPPPTTVAADGSLPVVVNHPPAAAGESAVPAGVSPPTGAARVEVPHVVTIPAGSMPPGAADSLFKVDPPAGESPARVSPVVVIESPAETNGLPTGPASLSATDILKQSSPEAAGPAAVGQGSVGMSEEGLASAVASARSLLPGDAPSLAHVSDDGSNSPTRLAPAAAATATDAGAVTAAETAYQQGLACEESGDFPAALTAYAEASRLNPNDPLPACRRGHVLCELGRTAEALAEFEAALRSAPGFSSAYFGRAHVKYVTDQLEDAVDDFSIALRLDDRHAQALLERGHCYARMGKAAEAAADRAAALALDPVLVESGPRYASEVLPRKPLPAGSIIVSDDGAADVAATTAAPLPSPASQTAGPQTTLPQPQSAFQNLFDGARPLDAGAPPAVASDGETAGSPSAVATASDDTSAVAPARAADRTTTSIELAADPALAAMNRSPASTTESGVVPLAADVVEPDAAKSDSPKAAAEKLAQLTRQLAERPGDASLYVARGRASLVLGDARAALDDVTTALRLAPKLREALVLRAETLSAINKFPAAHADYVELLAENPSDPSLYSGRGFVRLAMGQTGEAIEDFNAALRLDPKKGQVYCQRALAYALAGDRSASLADFNAALEASPTDAEVFVCRAKALSEFGDKKQALADLNQAIRLDPEKAEAYFERSRLYAERGAHENATADRRRAKQLDPSIR